MTSNRWIRIAAVADLPPREGRAVQLGGRELAVFNLGDRFFATDNSCPHKGGPLCDGIVAGSTVVCPLHAWKVNLETGQVERPAAANDCVQTYSTRVRDSVLEIDVALFRLKPEATGDVGGFRLPPSREASADHRSLGRGGQAEVRA